MLNPEFKNDTNLNCEHHVNDLSIKVNRANALLFKGCVATFLLVCFFASKREHL